MKKVYANITETIGQTPLVKLNRIPESDFCQVFVKLESFNPMSSVKDRIALAMLDEAKRNNKINRDTVIIEPTSGNTGIGLAFACAAMGYRLVLTMPETMSLERRKLIKTFGARIVLTLGNKGMKGAVDKAVEISKKIPNSYIPQQFNNEANPNVHSNTTAKELLHDLDGDIDMFVAGVGTGGTITGVGRVLKKRNPHVKIVAVEPEDSPVLSGGRAGPHRIQGIGAGFIPGILDKKLIDEVATVKDQEASLMASRLAQEEGILVGISSGAAAHVAIQLAARKENAGKNIVVILPDSGERYLSTWLFTNQFSQDELVAGHESSLDDLF